MSRTRARAGRGTTEVAAALEPLVLTVSVLHGGRAASLLAGLAAPLRPEALRRLACLERMGRAERHAALASAFARSDPGAARAAAIPGPLGAEVQKRLAQRGAPTGAPIPGAMERWARRLALELSALDCDDGRVLPPGKL